MPGDPNGTPHGVRYNTGTGKNRGASFANPVMNVTIYTSFLLSVQNVNGLAVDRIIFGLSGSTSGTNPDAKAGVWLDPFGRLKISKNSNATPATNTTYSLVASNAYFVVVRYKVNPGAPDEVNLWLDPTTLGNNASIPAPDLTTTNNANAATFNSMALYSGASAAPIFSIDEIRVSTNWSEVTPTNSPASAVYSVTGGGAGCPGNTFPIGLSGSDSGVTYSLYTNGVATGASVTGTGSALPFGPNSVTAVYTVLATSATGTNWMSGGTTISVLASPVITSQPTSVLTATNSTVVYSVSATGTGLGYQWYRNTSSLVDDSRISGSTTPLLAISGVTSADQATSANGYYCIITNSCSYAAISTTNVLTIQTASDLVWQGMPSNTWDNAVTANWTNGAGTAVVFNPGDNAVLNDTYQNQVVLLGSPYLSPGKVSYVSQYPMFIGGNGNLMGAGSALLVSSAGNGTLTISNANSFRGGTTISNGTLSIRNYGALGTGAVTLAGGTLDIPMKGSSSLGLTNNVQVTGNSTLQYAQNGSSFSAVLFGGLSGVSNTTLTISETDANTATLARLRLYGSATNNADIVLTTAGATNEVSPYGGTQVYGGIISGNGRFTLRGGTTILNKTNTLSDGIYSFILSGANLGLGIDSDGNGSPLGPNDLVIDQFAGNCTITAEGGNRSVGNGIHYLPVSGTDGGQVYLSGSNSLVLGGNYQLTQPSDISGINRTLNVNNTAATTLSGVISDGGLGSSLTKSGAGVLYLGGHSTFTGPVTNNAGVLAGSGSVAGPVIVLSSGAIGGGPAVSLGTLTISNSLTIGGDVFIRVNKASSPQSNDAVSVTGTLTNSGSGVVTITNMGVSSLAAGDRFVLFNKPLAGGAALTVTGALSAGLEWTNHLAVDGSVAVVAVGATAPPVINTQPAGRAVALGASVSLSVDASTSTGITNYQWQLNSNAIAAPNAAGINTATLTITNFQGANAGYYRVIVSDGSASTNSVDALLTLAVSPTIQNGGIATNTLTLRIPTEVGPTYLVQTNGNLANTTWQTAGTITGDGTLKPFTFGITNAPRLFFRVRLQ